MKILFINRRDWSQNIGGDSIQMLSIKKYLEKKDITVDIETDPSKIKKFIQNYDIVHIFNTQRVSETFYFTKISKKQNKKIIISPIYYDFSNLKMTNRLYLVISKLFGKRTYLIKDLLRVAKKVSYMKFVKYSILYDFDTMYKKIASLTDRLIPNSNAEAKFLMETYNIPLSKVKVIHNGVDLDLLNIEYDEYDFIKEFKIPFKPGEFILCVARIDERKNILNMLKAIEKLNLPLVLIGKYSPLHKKYFDKCKEIIERNRHIYYIPNNLPQNKLVGAYKACHAHILPSWVETPGLSSLEAALFGANIIVGDCEPVREYFGSMALYVKQNDVKDIQNTIVKAFERPRNFNKISEFIKNNYSWNKITERYIIEYEN